MNDPFADEHPTLPPPWWESLLYALLLLCVLLGWLYWLSLLFSTLGH